MTARKANERLVLDTTVDNLHAQDVLLGRKGERFLVQRKARWGTQVRVGTVNLATHEFAIHTLDQAYLVRVQVEHECDKCPGTGVYSWGGSVNGVPVNTGECYRCAGKGWQSRSDVIRNYTHDNYAGARGL